MKTFQVAEELRTFMSDSGIKGTRKARWGWGKREMVGGRFSYPFDPVFSDSVFKWRFSTISSTLPREGGEGPLCAGDWSLAFIHELTRGRERVLLSFLFISDERYLTLRLSQRVGFHLLSFLNSSKFHSSFSYYSNAKI